MQKINNCWEIKGNRNFIRRYLGDIRKGSSVIRKSESHIRSFQIK